VTSVTAPVRVLPSAIDPPQGAIFCGSPRSSSIVHDAGAINWGKAGAKPKCQCNNHFKYVVFEFRLPDLLILIILPSV